MSHRHIHCGCSHVELIHCPCCDVVYCNKCGKEWKYLCWNVTYPWTSTTITYEGTGTNGVNNSGSTVTNKHTCQS